MTVDLGKHEGDAVWESQQADLMAAREVNKAFARINAQPAGTRRVRDPQHTDDVLRS